MAGPRDALTGVRALVVEDEALIAEELRTRLQHLGVEVVEVVDNAEAAIRASDTLRPGLVLMDVRLKSAMDGVDAARIIRERHDVPVVFLTAHADVETVRRAKASDPHGYLLKPFHEADLTVAIELALHRHQADRRQAASERRSAETLNSIGDGVIAVDAAARVTFMNPVAEALTKWRLAEALGQPIDRVCPLVDETSRDPIEHPARAVLVRGTTVPRDRPALLMTADGESIPIDESAAPIPGADGASGAVIAFRDVRQRRLSEDALRQAQEQLSHAQKMDAVGRLAGGVAHDFNNLLTVINGYCEMLTAGGRLDSTSRELVGEVQRAGQRAQDLTRRLLSFSRRQIVQPETVDLGVLVSDLRNLIGRLVGPDVRLDLAIPPGLLAVRADPTQLEQVVINLAANARDAMPHGGVLAIEVRSHTGTRGGVMDAPLTPGVRLTMSDTGVGMDPAVRARAFEPFFTTKAMGEGTGLGLATVYSIVTQAGGAVDVDSRPGAGSTFRVWLPAVPVVPVMLSSEDDDAPMSRGGERILLADDDTAVRELLAGALRSLGYHVVEAEDGVAALDLFAADVTAVDLLLTDVVMPKMAGPELARAAQAARPGIRVLFISGHTDSEAFRRHVRDGHVRFLQKPFTLAVLAKVVRALLDAPQA